MDIAAMLTVQKMQAVQGQVSVAVASKVKDMVEQNGAELIKLMEQSANPHIGSHVDVKL